MALDVYVGSLTRYYAGDWESTGARTARDGAPQAGQPPHAEVQKKDWERIQASVLAWRRTLGQALGSHLAEPLSWNETSAAPWFTGRPTWEGFGALVLWAAYAEHASLRLPDVLPTEWDEDPALLRSNADGFRSRYSHLVRNVELWLPTSLDITFEGKDVDGRRIVIGSSPALSRQLAELNAGTWKMDDDQMALVLRASPSEPESLEESARYTLAMMSRLVQHAVQHRLPVKLDY